MTFTMVLFYFYILPVVITFLLMIVHDRITGENNFDGIGVVLIPVFNIMLLIGSTIILSKEIIQHNKMNIFLYRIYCVLTGTRDIKFETKHFKEFE